MERLLYSSRVAPSRPPRAPLARSGQRLGPQEPDGARPSLGWDAELTQIYPALRRLLRGGFVAMKRRRSEKGPPRREYRLTPAGRREFGEWLAEPLVLPRPRDASLARLAFLERQPRELRAARLLEYRVLVVAALKKASAGSTAARRRWRASSQPSAPGPTPRRRFSKRRRKSPRRPADRRSRPRSAGASCEKRATNFFRPARSK